MRNFRTYKLAVEFYRLSQTLCLPRHLRDQLARAASSIVLNLAEGSGRSSRADRNRFYRIAFGSLRECQAILDLAPKHSSTAGKSLDSLAAHTYKLIKATE
jgi:four helix bundle protein